MNRRSFAPQGGLRPWRQLMRMVVFTGMLFAVLSPCAISAAPATTPVAVVVDTDLWCDLDDAMALAMLHALVDRGEAQLLAVTVSTDDPWPVRYIDLLDRFYGHAVPIGLVHGGVDAQRFFARFPENVGQPQFVRTYAEEIASRRGAGGRLVYPRRIDPARVPEAVALLRKTLAAQPDGSVVMVELGFATNLARLLASSPDRFSPLDGRALVARKVRRLVAMAGRFAATRTNGQTLAADTLEFNVMLDVPSAQALFRRWPTPVVVSGHEVGIEGRYPGARIASDFNYVEYHPIAEAYRYVDPFWKQLYQHSSDPALHDHGTYDLTAMLYAVRPDRGYFSLSEPGRVEVDDRGVTRFVTNAHGLQRYLRWDAGQRARALEAMELLVSQPPRARRR